MERNDDEVIADMLIQLAQMGKRMEKADRRADLTIRRMVKAETRLDASQVAMEALVRRIVAGEQKLERSIEDQAKASAMQSKMNQYFLKQIRNK